MNPATGPLFKTGFLRYRSSSCVRLVKQMVTLYITGSVCNRSPLHSLLISDFAGTNGVGIYRLDLFESGICSSRLLISILSSISKGDHWLRNEPLPSATQNSN